MELILLFQLLGLLLLLTGGLTYLLLRTHKKLKSSEQQVEQHQHAIRQFLRREIKASRNWLLSNEAIPKKNDDTKERTRRLMHAIRHHWLTEEINALNNDGMESSNMIALEQQLIPFCEKLIKNISKPPMPADIALAQQEKASPIGELQKRSATKIAILEAQIETQHKTIEELRQKLAALSTNNPALIEECNNFEKIQLQSDNKIRELNHSMEEMRGRYAALQTHLEGSHDSVLLIQTQKTNDFPNVHDDTTLKSLHELQHAHNSVLKELNHLREINNEKRSLILKLETELIKLKEQHGDSQETQAAEELIKRLRLQLRDSEMCTATLEAESEDLRSRLQVISHTQEHQESEHESTNTIMDELEELKKSQHLKTHLMRCSSELINCKTLEDITRTLISFLIQTEFNVTIYMCGTGKDCIMSTSGTSNDVKELLRGISPDEDWLDTRQGKILSLPHCRILISNITQKNNLDTLEDIALIIETANAVALQLELTLKKNQQRAIMEKLIAEAKKSLSGIEVQNKYMADEGGKAMKNHYDQITHFAETLDLSETQRKCILEILDELKARMQILFGTRTSLDSSFTSLITLLDKKGM